MAFGFNYLKNNISNS